MSVVQSTIFVALALSPALVASRGLYEEFDTGNDVDNFGRQILVTSNFTEPSTAVILGLSVAVVLAIPTIILLLMGRSAYNKNRRNDNQQHSYFGGYSNGYARYKLNKVFNGMLLIFFLSLERFLQSSSLKIMLF